MDWRVRWAERENARRRNAYEAVMVGWLHANSELRKMIEAARTFDGVPLRQAPDWLDLRRGERLLWLGSDAEVVETRAWRGLTEPSYADLTTEQLLGEFNRRRRPARAEVMGSGRVAVTDQGVVVATSPLEEWAYDEVDSLAQPANLPCTLLRLSGRPRVVGIVLDPEDAPYFRFNLAVGLADRVGKRAGLIALLERRLASHQLARPVEPVMVGPEAAPAPVWWLLGLVKAALTGPRGASPRRRLVHLGATFAALVVAATLVAPRGGPEDRNLAAGPSPLPQNTQVPASTPARSSTPTPTPVERLVTQTETIPFETKTVPDPAMDEGTQKIRTTGVPGIRQRTYAVTSLAGRETARRLVHDQVTKAPITQVVAIGTREPPPAPVPRKPVCDPNYRGACVPIASDVDCAGSREDGPAYVEGPVYVVGRDIYRLDRNHDGVGCDSTKRGRVTLSRPLG